MMKRWQTLAAIGLALAGLFLWILRAVDAQRPKGSDDTQIRMLIANGAAAAMRRDPASMGQLIANDYKDNYGFRAPALRQQIARVLREAPPADGAIPGDQVPG